MKKVPTTSSRAFTAFRLPLMVGNSTNRPYAEPKRLRLELLQSGGSAFVVRRKEADSSLPAGMTARKVPPELDFTTSDN
jgi:hypothetical protein